jgi:hypothetical protein
MKVSELSIGAGGRNRTDMDLRPRDFESFLDPFE